MEHTRPVVLILQLSLQCITSPLLVSMSLCPVPLILTLLHSLQFLMTLPIPFHQCARFCLAADPDSQMRSHPLCPPVRNQSGTVYVPRLVLCVVYRIEWQTRPRYRNCREYASSVVSSSDDTSLLPSFNPLSTL